MPPHTLKFTQVSVGKWNATYQFATAIATKNPTHDQVTRRPDRRGGSVTSRSRPAIRSRPEGELADREHERRTARRGRSAST